MAGISRSLKAFLALPDDRRRVGPFVLVHQLGRGGFAPVWLAREMYGTVELRPAALKLFSLDAPSSGGRGVREYRDRVVEEARALCQVSHPNIVRFYSLPTDEAGGVMGLAMEYVAGKPLDARLANGTRPDLGEVLALGSAVASALSAVHRAGLVHRDVKPANVIDAAGVYKLIDFGIASAEREKAATRTLVMLDELPLEVPVGARERLEGAVTLGDYGEQASSSGGPRGGTVGYMDPACVQDGAPATPASDLYGLGATLFQCLTGRLPAAAEEEGAGVKREVLDGRARAPSLLSLRADAPAALARIVDALLAPIPKERPGSAEWVAIELERIRGELAGRDRALPPESTGPFRGLGRFEGEDRDVLFGREREVASALELLRGQGIVALVGASGSGKSSLARAGILPRVAEGALGAWPAVWDPVIAVPGRDPRAALLSALAASGIALSEADPSPEAVIGALASRIQASGRGVVLLVDQLEELVTAASGPSLRWAAELLAQLGQQPLPGLRTIVALRRDLLDPILSLEGLGRSIVRGSLLVEPISDATWADVVDQALAAYGYSFEDQALRAELSAGLRGTSGAMPLVQFALTELWNKRDAEKKLITREGFDAIGGISGALERHADRSVTALWEGHPGARAVTREVLLLLTTAQGTRATRPAGDLGRIEGSARVLDALDAARLVTRAEDGITLAHEALITQWGKLRAWVSEVREDRLLAEELEQDAARFRADSEAVALWRKRRLASAAELETRGDLELSAPARLFLAASRRAERRARVVALAALTVSFAGLFGGGTAYVRAVREKERAALERASMEEQKRIALEAAQTALDRQKSTIDGLVRQLTDAKDNETVLALQRQLKQAQQPERPASERAAAALAAAPRRPSTGPESTGGPPPPAPAQRPSAPQPSAQTIKVQQWE